VSDTASPSRKALAWGVLASLIAALLIPLFDVLIDVTLLPDQGASWYYWKLADPTWITRLSAWLPYVIHQGLVWYLIYRLVQSRKRTDGTLNRWNIALFAVNAVFVVAHFVQTYFFYDGTAQDVPVMSSQGSVIVMLVLILIMENRRRGLFFGRKVPLPKDGVLLTRKFHGYYIAWAAVYTFWYHPVVSSVAHVMGFFYMFLLFVQLSLAYTREHLNKYWTLALEVTVLVHGTTVAFFTQDSIIWTMFFSGFLTLFIVTQIYGLGLPKRAIRMASGVYLVAVLALYTFYPDGAFSTERLAQLYQLTWIPIIEYGMVFAFAGILWGVSLVPGVNRTLHPLR